MERYVNLKEIAEFLAVSPNTVYYWISIDFIPHYRLPKGVRFKTSEIERWMSRRKKIGRDQTRIEVLDEAMS
jgi:excisionase family DNA binding protein